MRLRACLPLIGVLVVAGCAAKRPVTMPASPTYPAYETPAVPPDLAARVPGTVRRHNDAWALLQSGDIRGARARFSEIVAKAPEFYPSEAALGYVDLSLGEDRGALERFTRALERNGAYVPALLGQADALGRLDRGLEAVAALESAAAAAPSRADIRQRLEVARLTAVEEVTSRARRAVREGQLGEARQAYERALAVSPDSPFLRRELAVVDVRLGDLTAAEAQVNEAIRLDPGDPLGQVARADVLEAMGRWQDAADALRAAERLGAADVGTRIRKLDERAALDALPEEYRAIPDAPRVTRAELAALIAVRIPRLVDPAPATRPLITDLGGHWARTWVLAVAAAGLMEVYPNHTFQPGQVVTRSGLADAMSRVLATIAVRAPGTARSWTGARQSFADIGPGHLAYPAASVAVASGVMQADRDGTFSPARVVTGREAAETVTRLERLASRALRDPGA